MKDLPLRVDYVYIPGVPLKRLLARGVRVPIMWTSKTVTIPVKVAGRALRWPKTGWAIQRVSTGIHATSLLLLDPRDVPDRGKITPMRAKHARVSGMVWLVPHPKSVDTVAGWAGGEYPPVSRSL